MPEGALKLRNPQPLKDGGGEEQTALARWPLGTLVATLMGTVLADCK